jgi:mannosyltransferase
VLARRGLALVPAGLALVTGLAALNSKAFTTDEAVSVILARLPWRHFGDLIVHRETNGSLYFTALHVLTGGRGGEWGVRLPSVGYAVISAFVFFLLLQRLFDRRIALVSASLFALSPLQVEYSQTAREYVLAGMFVVLATYLFVRGMQQPSTLVWIAYAFASAAAAYSFLLAAAVPAAHALSLAALPRDRVPWRRVAIGLGGFLVLLLPLLGMLSQTNASGGVAWASGNVPGRIVVSLRDHFPRAVVVVAFFLLTATLAVLWWRVVSRYERDPRAWPLVLIAAWLLVPSYLVSVAAFVWQPLFIVRYFLVFAPPLLVGLGWLALRAWPLALVIAIAVVLGLAHWYNGAAGTDYRGASAYVSRSAAPSDGVLFYAPYVRMPFELYFERTARSRTVRPVYPDVPWRRAPARFIEYVPMPLEAVSTAVARYRRIWLVLAQDRLYGQDDPGYDHVVAALRRGGFKLVQDRSYPGVLVRRYER